MDKNTLSNYGWIVIAVLVLSVMIALATPFGEYIKAGVESTTAGLFNTSEKALNVVGMSGYKDNTISKKGSIANVVKNGNFVNTDEWIAYGTNALNVTNNTVTLTNSDSKQSSFRQNRNDVVLETGKRFLVSYEYYVEDDETLNQIFLKVYSTNNISTPISSPGPVKAYNNIVFNKWTTYSSIITVPESADGGTLYFLLGKSLTTSPTEKTSIQFKNVNIIDLSASDLGSKTLTKDEITEIIYNYFGGYVDGTCDFTYKTTVLSGKTCVVLGDSIMAGDVPATMQVCSGIDGMTVYNCAVGGTRAGKHIYESYNAMSLYNIADAISSGDYSSQITATNTLTKFKTQINTLTTVDFSSVDYIVIAFGTNDFTGNNSAIYEKENFESYQYALSYSIDKIQTAYPDIEIMLVTPMFRGDVGTEETDYSDNYVADSGYKLTDFVNAVKTVGAKYNIPVSNNYDNLGINETNFAQYLEDGVHPNAFGVELIANTIIKQMITHFTE